MRPSRHILCGYCAVLAAVALSLPREAAAQRDEECVLVVYQLGDLLLNVRDYPYPAGDRSSLGRAPAVRSGGMGGMGGGIRGGMGGMSDGMGGGGMGMFGDKGAVGDTGSPQAGQLFPGRTDSLLYQIGGVGTPKARESDSSGSTQITMDDIVEAIMAVVEPMTWDVIGGPGSIRPLGNTILVSQTAAVHRQIEGLLVQLREGLDKRRTVTIDARWLLLDSDELEELMTVEEGAVGVDREVLATFTRRPSSIRGLTNCFNSQLVYLVSGTRQNVVSSYIPVVGSLDRPEEKGSHLASLKGDARIIFTQIGPGNNRSVGYQPVVERPNFGALLEIRPTLVFGEEAAIVDLRSTLTVLGEQQGDLLERFTEGRITPAVDRVAIETQELATTLSVPLGRPVLVGGLTYVPPSIRSSRENAQAGAMQPQETPTETPQLYLILEVTLQ